MALHTYRKKPLWLRPVPLSPPQFLAVFFLVFMLSGALLLKLPFSTVKPISWIDSVFLATSAATVTGLVPLDPGTTFSIFGEIVILCLIQMGGLGLMSFAALVVIMLGKKVSIKQRKLMQESLNQPSIGGVIRLVRNLVIFSLSIQFIGVVLLCFRFVPDMGWNKGIYYSVYHTISAYNNAGFALWPDSLSRYVGDPLVNLVITFLIITGGIGFTVLVDVWLHRRFKKLSLHSRVMIIGTLLINLIAIFCILALEFHNPHTLGGLPLSDKLWAAYFQGISPRTAGFNTIDIGQMKDSSILFTIMLMFIGAGSGSTAGGIKLTTLIVIIYAVTAFLKGNNEMVIGNRTVRNEVVMRALAITTISILFIFFAFFILTITQKISFIKIFFEVVSAFGTVGLSMGITAELNHIGKLVIIIVMLFGKIGPLTMAFSLAKASKTNIRYPDGDLFTG
ncbi:TrkH family potassium uptake protein [Fictibacillus fluitans]